MTEVILTPEQKLAQKKANEAKQKKLMHEFAIKKEQLSRELNVIEIPIIKYDPIRGITPDSVVMPHEWKDGETYLEKNEQEETAK